jgi:hypothetical protein
MGSLHNYRRWLKNAGFGESDPKKMKGVLEVGDDGKRLSLMGHAIAGEFRDLNARASSLVSNVDQPDGISRRDVCRIFEVSNASLYPRPCRPC